MNQPIIIYHNGECSKSAGALEILQQRQVPHIVRWYLSDPLTKQELQALLIKLNMQPSQIVRENEPVFRENFAGNNYNEAQLLEILCEHPVLLERPIVAYGEKAIVARPPERVLAFLEEIF